MNTICSHIERNSLLRLAYSRSDIGHNKAFLRFCEKNQWWLDDFALFMAVKDRFEGRPWIEWAEDIRLRWQNAMDYYRRELYYEVEYYKYIQFKFDEQWSKLKTYANSKGIQIIGDIPIYVALDSADAWANPGLFQLDEENIPTAVAGVPPDGFSATGQLWGNPLYRWEVHRNTGTALNCMMWYVSITSVGLMSIFQFLMAVKQLHQDTGKKDRALNCSVRWSRHWANGKSLRKTLAI